MTDTPITTEVVDRLAQEYDDRVRAFDAMIDATPESVRALRRDRNKQTRQQHAETAATLRALRAALDKAEAERVKARREALEEAAAACERIRIQKTNGPMPENACFDYKQTIRALIDGEGSNADEIPKQA